MMIDTTLGASAASTPKLGASAGSGGDRNADWQTLQKKAVEFEAVYLSEMLKPMFEGLKTDEQFGGGEGEDMWRSMQVQEYGSAIAKSGGVGLAAPVAKALLQAQEAREGSPR
ncbi:MAG: rod-binding protein [Rhodospirillales bacterium]|nr:rod-binding protein [Rhodospirillales bacterium]